MNKQEELTHFMYGMFGEDNVSMVTPDCVQNDCYAEGVVDRKIVIYHIRNCSRNMYHQVEWCLQHKHDVTHVTRFDPYTNSCTIKILIKDDESEESSCD